jgi:hypothetical protein
MAPALIKAAGDCFYDGRASSYCSSDTTITTTPAAAATAAALLQWHSLPAISLCRCAVCAALSDSVRRKILIPARVPFSDFYFYVLSFNFGAAAAAVAAAALAVHTPAAAACVCASPGNFSLFIFLYGCWQTSRSLPRSPRYRKSFFTRVSSFAGCVCNRCRRMPIPCTHVLITTSLGCHFVWS